MDFFSMQQEFSRDISSLQQLSEFAEQICKNISLPAVFLLYGELGCGKTEFVRRLAKCYQVQEKVQSPTFNLMHTYQGILPNSETASKTLNRPLNTSLENLKEKEHDIVLFHLDFYRLGKDGSQEAALDFDFWQLSQGKQFLILAEWPQKVALRWSVFSREIYAFYFTMEEQKQSSTHKQKQSQDFAMPEFLRAVTWKKYHKI